jgi:hypothetical protein
MLLVPIGYGLVALESGGTSSGCPSASGGPGSRPAGGGGTPARPGGPALTLRSSRTDVTVGQRVRLTGALSGAATAGAYPSARLGRRDRVLVCTREPTPDAFGRSSPLDRLCGRSQLPRQPTAAASVRPRSRA